MRGFLLNSFEIQERIWKSSHSLGVVCTVHVSPFLKGSNPVYNTWLNIVQEKKNGLHKNQLFIGNTRNLFMLYLSNETVLSTNHDGTRIHECSACSLFYFLGQKCHISHFQRQIQWIQAQAFKFSKQISSLSQISFCVRNFSGAEIWSSLLDYGKHLYWGYKW